MQYNTIQYNTMLCYAMIHYAILGSTCVTKVMKLRETRDVNDVAIFEGRNHRFQKRIAIDFDATILVRF